VVERQLAGMMAKVGANFKKGQPTKMWGLSMSGKYAPQQRAIKLIEANKRVAVAAGAGSGKTNMMLGAHAHLASQGKIKRSIMMVPSIVQGQFNGEALRLLEPGKFKAHIQPGASQAERIAAYKDPDTHICVMTHQSFRDDLIHLGAQKAGIDEAAMGEQLAAMSRAERKAWASETLAHHGIAFDASFVDEAHDTLNRAGKENSALSNVLDSVTDNTPYYTYASGDPVKNDASEIHSMLQKMDPERYADRAEFMRRYGADTIASKQGLQREMARYVFPTSITPDVNRDRKVERVELSGGQKKALSELDANVRRARMAQRKGKVDVEACKAISPNSFEGVPAEEHEKVAAALQKSVGILKESAQARIINAHPDNAKVKHALKMVEQRPGKQGVIFAKNRASVEQYRKALEAAGKRVVVITGADGAKDKDRKRLMFNPEKGPPEADILVASDAAAVGMNLQSGHFLIQHDVPDTAKTHGQRNARIDRIGQGKDIELVDLVGNHKSEDRARDRLARKYGLKDLMASPLDGLDDTGVAGAINARRAAAESSQGSMF
jgi:superfamily II DNA or RNA helicase